MDKSLSKFNPKAKPTIPIVEKEKGKKKPVTRHFQNKWKFNENGEERVWLVYDNETKLMFCEFCNGGL